MNKDCDYQGAISVFKDYVDFHDCHSKSNPGIGKEAIEVLQELVDRDKPMPVKRFPERTLCPKCGAVVTGGSFCIHCGQRLDFGVSRH